MAFLTVKNVLLSGVSACVPKQIQENINYSGFSSKEEAERFIISTGVERRRIGDYSITTADLCVNAAEELIKDLSWQKKDIDCLIFVSQTPEYILPATSCILQNRLGLEQDCYALDVSLGCSGWVYGVSVISSLLSSGNFKKGLLLCGEVSSMVNLADKSAYPLFGDAGTVTAFEYKEGASDIHFSMSTDGAGYESIIIPDGGRRNRTSLSSLELEEIEEGIKRTKLDVVLNGMDIFAFGISKVPKSINEMIEYFSLEKDKIDFFLFHQANLFMNEKIRKKINVSKEKVPYSLANFGNTSSASIPLTMVSELSSELKMRKLHLLSCGFGVGFSWGSVYLETENIVCSSLVEL